jgi:hypothetical protein
MTTTARGRGHAAAGAGVPDLALAVLAMAMAGACAPPPGRQLCEAIAKRDVPGVHAALERAPIDLLKAQEGCTPVEAVFGKARPDDAALTEIGVELVRAGLPAQAAWEEGTERRRVMAVEAAAGNGNAELVRALLAVGLRVHDAEAIRALHLAAGAGHLKVVQVLVREGVDPAAEFAGRTPAVVAHEQGRDEVEKFLVDELAARAEAADRAKRAAALAESAAPAAPDDSGETAAPPRQP